MYLTTVIVTRPACTLRPVCLFVFLSHAIKVRDDDILSLFSLLNDIICNYWWWWLLSGTKFIKQNSVS